MPDIFNLENIYYFSSCSGRMISSLRASSPFGSHAIFILGEIYLGLARDLGASRERIGTGAR